MNQNDSLDKSLSIMIIDSNLEEGLLTARLVQQSMQGNAVILRAESVEKALDITRDSSVDCVILDLFLDEKSTNDPLKNLRKIINRQFLIDAPVIVVTEENHERIGVDAIRLGAQDFIAKDHLSTNNIGKMISYAIERYKNLRSAKDDSLTDACTGLYNGRWFVNIIQHLIHEKERSGSSFVIAVVNIDNFKEINDKCGYAVGDQVLNNIGACLKQHLRKTDHVARLGDDVFAISLSNIEKETHVKEILGEKLESIRDVLHMTLNRVGYDIELESGASIGWVWWERGLSAENTIRQAEDVMYAAKLAGKNKIEGGSRLS